MLRDGALVAAAQEERFTRIKHDASLPVNAFRYCLAEAGLRIEDVDGVAYYEDPAKKLERQLWMHLPDISIDGLRRLWWRAKQPLTEIRELLGWEGPIDVVPHHAAHAASSFFYSGFEEAAIMTVDAVGEWATTAYGHGHGTAIDIFDEVTFPDSLGLLYSAITSYLGFAVNDGEYKVMGLAPYGRPTFVEHVQRLITSDHGGHYHLSPAYFDFSHPRRMYTDALCDLFGKPPRASGARIEQTHCDIARSTQWVLEEMLVEKAHWLHGRVPNENLCLAGGVALNCVANSRLLRDGPFRRLFVQPAAGDAGAALGAASLAQIGRTGVRLGDGPLRHVYLGPRFDSDEVARLLSAMAAIALDCRDREEELLAAVVDRLAAGQVVGWLHGRMEFGPRALGARSILADPRDPQMRDRVNSLVKLREGFRPFGPVVLEEDAAEHFDLDHPSPFMLETCQVRSRLSLPAITHVDGSARVQTLRGDAAPRFAKLLRRFGERTGCPILLNTSFNLRDEPIVCTPLDALRCFARSRIDALVLEEFLLDRAGLSAWSVERLSQHTGRLSQHTARSSWRRPPDAIYPLN